MTDAIDQNDAQMRDEEEDAVDGLARCLGQIEGILHCLEAALTDDNSAGAVWAAMDLSEQAQLFRKTITEELIERRSAKPQPATAQ